MNSKKWPLAIVLCLASVLTVSCGLFENPEKEEMKTKVAGLEERVDKLESGGKSEDTVTETATKTITQTE